MVFDVSCVFFYGGGGGGWRKKVNPSSFDGECTCLCSISCVVIVAVSVVLYCCILMRCDRAADRQHACALSVLCVKSLLYCICRRRCCTVTVVWDGRVVGLGVNCMVISCKCARSGAVGGGAGPCMGGENWPDSSG